MEMVKRAKVMRKEWWKSKSTELSINDLVGLGVLHDKALGGWRASNSESFLDPQPGEVVVFEDFFKRGFGVPIHPFLRGCVCTMRLGFAICIPTQSFSSPLSFIFMRLLEDFCHILISSAIFSVFGRRGLGGFSDCRWGVLDTP
jgi:hypothetical protein